MVHLYLLLSEVHDLPVEESVVLLQRGHGRLSGDAVSAVSGSVLTSQASVGRRTSGVHLEKN